MSPSKIKFDQHKRTHAVKLLRKEAELDLAKAVAVAVALSAKALPHLHPLQHLHAHTAGAYIVCLYCTCVRNNPDKQTEFLWKRGMYRSYTVK